MIEKALEEVSLMMSESERNVYSLLRHWRRLHAEKEFFELRTDLSEAQRAERTEQIHRLLTLLEKWMRQLTIDERYIVKRYLVDNLRWRQLVCEYNTKLGRPCSKSLSSLRKIQSRAIQKLAQYAQAQDIRLK